MYLVLHPQALLDPLSCGTAPPTPSGICLAEQMGPLVLVRGHKIRQLGGLSLHSAAHERNKDRASNRWQDVGRQEKGDSEFN